MWSCEALLTMTALFGGAGFATSVWQALELRRMRVRVAALETIILKGVAAAAAGPASSPAPVALPKVIA
jgi:hypothetical protein